MKTDIRKKEIIWEDNEQRYLLWFDVGALGKIKNLSFAKGNKGEEVLTEQEIVLHYSSSGLIKNILTVIRLRTIQIWRCLYLLAGYSKNR